MGREGHKEFQTMELSLLRGLSSDVSVRHFSLFVPGLMSREVEVKEETSGGFLCASFWAS